MSHFAKIKNGIVTEVIVAEQDHINTLDGQWVQTSYNTYENQHPEGRPLRGNFAGVGDTYDPVNDVFYKPQPFPSWTLNKTIWAWDAPKPTPNIKGQYATHTWDDDAGNWVLVQPLEGQ
jgi:hypothetical protein